jgi:hypothetical protein
MPLTTTTTLCDLFVRKSLGITPDAIEVQFTEESFMGDTIESLTELNDSKVIRLPSV